ncbi:MAG: replicative DNA helicase [Clostridia bacterium]|nr:replicative DNA helicase [Clostridia bacterium]
MAVPLDRVPPQAIEAEEQVLGALLLDRDALVRVAVTLAPQDFYKEAHRLIYEAMLALFDRGQPVDVITLADELGRKDQLERAGGVAYLASLASSVATAANVDYHARIVQEKSMLRQLLAAVGEISASVFNSGEEVDTLLDQAENRIFQVSQRRQSRSYEPLRDVLVKTFEEIERLYTHRGEVIGIPSGFPDLDRLTSGWHPSELIIVAARPSQGKTALSLNMAAVAAVRHKVPVAIFSLEMSKEQLAQRLLCAEAQVPSVRLRTGTLSDEDWPKLSRALGRLSEAPIYIDDTPNISVLELRAKARRLKAERNIGMVVVDYLQLMRSHGRAESRQQEISEISRSLKSLARELSVPVVALSQLSRAVEQRQDRRPQLSDLRESGAIEQDADVVTFIYQNPEMESSNVVELILAKQRNGPVGSAQLVFLREIGKFVSLDRRQQAG